MSSLYPLDEAGGAEAAVDVGAREVDVTLDGSNDSTVRARHASSEVLSHSAAAVAETKLLAANAYDTTIVGAGCALAVAWGAVVGNLRSSRGSGSRRLVRSGLGRLSRLSSGCSSRSRRSTRCKDTARVDRGLGVGGTLVDWRRNGSRVATTGLGCTLGWCGRSTCRRAADLTSTCTECVLALATRAGHSVTRATRLDSVRASIGEDEVLLLSSAALSGWEVDNEHVGKGRQSLRSTRGRCGGSAAADLDRSTVHVELAVANLVHPGPGECVAAIWDILGHSDRKAAGNTSQRGLSGLLWCVSGVLSSGAPSNVALDDLPLRLLRGLRVSGD